VSGGVDLDFSMFRFHVPIELSAPNKAMHVTAKPMNTFNNVFRIFVHSLLSLILRRDHYMARTTLLVPVGRRFVGSIFRLIALQHSLDQPAKENIINGPGKSGSVNACQRAAGGRGFGCCDAWAFRES
jgi:hypothetical protein